MYRVGLMALTDPVLPWMYLKMHLFSTEKWQENKDKYYINLLNYMYMYCSYNSEPGLQIIFLSWKDVQLSNQVIKCIVWTKQKCGQSWSIKDA